MSFLDDNQDTKVEIEPKQTADASIIWLHGLGANGNDFAPIVPELHLDKLNIRFIFPHAPYIPVTINQGERMRAWFDIYDLKLGAKIDEERINASVAIVDQYIQAEIDKGIKTEKIMLAGFSQGAVVALTTALTLPYQLAGVIALSGFLPHLPFLNELNPKSKKIPIFLAHGTQDMVLPFVLGNQTKTMLEQRGFDIHWKQYNMGHQVSNDEINDISSFIQSKLT